MSIAFAFVRGFVAFFVFVLVCACVSPATALPASPSASASPSPTVSPTATAGATGSPSPSPTATPLGGVYTNFAVGYQIELPGPWRRSECLSSQDPFAPPAVDSFVRVPEQDERGTDIAFYPFEIVQVWAHENPSRVSADEWIASGKIGFTQGQTSQPAMLDGRGAVLVRPTASFALAYVLALPDRVFMVAYQNGQSDQLSAPTMEHMVRSFHLLTEQERAAAPSYPPPPARSIERTADVLADGFASQDPALLSTVMAPCMSASAENAGGTWVPRNVFMTQLRDAFIAGLRVTVVRRAIEADQFGMFLKATWAQPGAPAQQRDLYLSRRGDVWSWNLTLTRQPVR